MKGNCFLFVKISHAQPNRSWPKPSTTSGPQAQQPKLPQATTTPATPTPATPSYFEKITPKCYPETATAYFLPAPPTSPKVTVLDSSKDLSSLLKVKEVPSSTLASNILANRGSFSPPPAVKPDLIHEVPSLIQDRFSRMSESDVKVCTACANLIEKLPIFNFDQELLNGFLSGLGI
ncbi:uncharacterized protein LOC142984358 [Anticarsia gemmatalis]|uniref:uncharacterized protein LOC142984358 n=1 Tax=Anticarsia gemmatalis TaxID=129554 RepID=UPI003F76BD11